jgi:membrane-anchored protein YejM (alkaline phosphatase superfamily)
MVDPLTEAAGARRRGYLLPALAWALLHAPLFLVLYASPIAAAVQATPERWRAFLWPTFLPQAGLLALVAWLLGVPFAPWPRVYRFAAPAAAALTTAVVALDSRVFGALGYHLNGFFLQLMLQPDVLRESGVPPSDVALFVGLAVAFGALDVWAGAAFVRRFAAPRAAWKWGLALALLAGAERTYGGAMVHFGGPAFFAASTVLPLQVPVRMEHIVNLVLRRPRVDPLVGGGAGTTPPRAVVDPGEVRFTRRPDVLFIVAESLPSEHLDERTMPNLWRRALSGARFPHHYSGASNTEFGIFSLVYGLQAHKLDSEIGAGRRPLLFPAFLSNGYQLRVLASSCVDWMGMKQTVFGGVQDVLETWCAGHDPRTADLELLESARRFVASARPDQPLFLFLFLFGTHFNYFRDPEDVVFTPEWDGSGGIRATVEPGWKIQNRARNAAHALDRRVEAFLSWFDSRGRGPPVVFFTGDHGEEFRQKGFIGHGSQVTREQVNVPAVWFGPDVRQGVFEAPTSHADVLPTLLRLLGDGHAPALYSDGLSMFHAPRDRYVVSTVGWEPSYAVIGIDLKVRTYAGMATTHVTDPDDQPLADGQARLARDAPRILRALRGEPEPDPAP